MMTIFDYWGNIHTSKRKEKKAILIGKAILKQKNQKREEKKAILIGKAVLKQKNQRSRAHMWDR